MKTLLYANRAEPKSISVISILLLAAVRDITKLRCMHRECYIFASQNLWYNIGFIIYTILLFVLSFLTIFCMYKNRNDSSKINYSRNLIILNHDYAYTK